MRLATTLAILGACCMAGATTPTITLAQDKTTDTTTKTVDLPVTVEVPGTTTGVITNTTPPVVNPTPRTGVRAETRKSANSESSARTEGLTYVQLLALQQQLRDDGCGVSNVTGVLDAQTRRAIAKCKKKYGVTGSGRDLLTAMNIGFDANTEGMGTVMGGGNK